MRLWTSLHHMVILRSQNKITDFFMILAWACPSKLIEIEDKMQCRSITRICLFGCVAVFGENGISTGYKRNIT